MWALVREVRKKLFLPLGKTTGVRWPSERKVRVETFRVLKSPFPRP